MDYFSFVILWSWRRALIQSLTFGHFLQNLEIGTINVPLIIVPPTQDDTFFGSSFISCTRPLVPSTILWAKKQEQKNVLISNLCQRSKDPTIIEHKWEKSAKLLIKAPKLCKMMTENSLYTQGRVSWFPSACFSLTHPVIARGIGMSCID